MMMDAQNDNFQNFVLLIKALTDNQNGGDSLKQAESVLGNLCEQSPEFFLLASVALLQIPNLDPNVCYHHCYSENIFSSVVMCKMATPTFVSSLSKKKRKKEKQFYIYQRYCTSQRKINN
jgi:hypothetical protein